MASEFAERQKRDFFRDISALGSLIFYILVVLLFLILEIYNIFFKLLVGLVVIHIVVILFKTFFFKERPKKFTYDSYISKLDAASFPSLHAARTAFMGLSLSKYFDNYIFTTIMILMILLIAYTRIYLKKHDFMDVAAGIIIVKEAGGKVSDFRGENDFLFGKEILAASLGVFEELKKVVGGF